MIRLVDYKQNSSLGVHALSLVYQLPHATILVEGPIVSDWLFGIVTTTEITSVHMSAKPFPKVVQSTIDITNLQTFLLLLLFKTVSSHWDISHWKVGESQLRQSRATQPNPLSTKQYNTVQLQYNTAANHFQKLFKQ